MLPERSRGMLEFDPSVCTGCVQCGKQCPIDCFDIEVVKNEETKQRMLTKFEIDLGKCMYCGICVENCTQGGLRHTAEFEGSVADVKRLKVNFITKPLPTVKPKKGEEPKLKPKGSIIREYMRDQWKSAERSESKPVKKPIKKPAEIKKPESKEGDDK
jgi:formate hydrogenlyase subunit 6/NADH:ubiquinone oxidoreductase subunit I